MIQYLEGEVLDSEGDALTVCCAGVGYGVAVTQETIDSCVLGERVKIFVYTHVREDQLSLFGFLTKAERKFFIELLKVNGVGPKMGMQVMSGARFDTLVQLIESENVTGLTQLPKVGKKTAEQMVLTLKGKLSAYSMLESRVVSSSASLGLGQIAQQVSSALSNLGYKPADIERVKTSFAEATELQAGIKQGLQALSGHL